jgi:hypothetical protein
LGDIGGYLSLVGVAFVSYVFSFLGGGSPRGTLDLSCKLNLRCWIWKWDGFVVRRVWAGGESKNARFKLTVTSSR